MKKYKRYEEIKNDIKRNKNRPFDELFDEGFYESLDLVNKIVIQSYGFYFFPGLSTYLL